MPSPNTDWANLSAQLMGNLADAPDVQR
jgi:hypothetical protein